MLRVLFFGRIREELGCAHLSLEHDESTADLERLQQELVAANSEKWAQVLSADNIIRAVNQQVAQGNVALCDGDEVAFFPPVTGG
ncbi:molybdopterin synthase sulfur carrier subunit [Pseudohalioglobus sediminis]|uniref:Molybdopterin synthase sulfur carrier subunit n=1 Tax=Pseudohalioglobus sediminis TaxID=2606449 RepID=A0A5B0X162_9GAMM|nr:MoaD/ThiS family protein [Pseudohalioglobus sediminis]KAA1193026.1 molybdopterin synthase sulfur carrier subunit [Pseudohalioglobus sediminis]